MGSALVPCQRVRRHISHLARKVIIITNFSNLWSECGVANSFLISNLALCALCVSCSTIDDDLSQCEYSKIDYDLTLVTNITTEIETQLETQLSTQMEMELGIQLREFLGDIFTDHAHDVDLSFYDTHGDSLRLQHDEHIMDANQASYTLNLPKREYMHLAAANVVDNKLVDLVNDERCHHSILYQDMPDTIASHTTGLFTARQDMEVLEGVNQNFSVHLYMANCAAALVLDTQGYDISGMQVYSTGFATGFFLCDSSYVYSDRPPIVRTTKIAKTEDSQEVAFCSVNFPSRDVAQTRTIIETTEPFITPYANEALWEFRVYVPVKDGTRQGGSITETVMRIKQPLRAGQLKIIKGRVNENGVVVPDNPEVSTSVTLDWKEGLDIEG